MTVMYSLFPAFSWIFYEFKIQVILVSDQLYLTCINIYRYMYIVH